MIAGPDDRILVTGAAGFIGARVVQNILDRGYRNLVCFIRPSSETIRMEEAIAQGPADARVEIVRGNLLSREDCEKASVGATVVYHIAAGIGEKSYPTLI